MTIELYRETRPTDNPTNRWGYGHRIKTAPSPLTRMSASFQQPAASGQQPIRMVVARLLTLQELFQAPKSSAPVAEIGFLTDELNAAKAGILLRIARQRLRLTRKSE